MLVVEMMGLEPTTPCLQSSRELAVCYAGKTLLSGDRKLSSYGVVSAFLRARVLPPAARLVPPSWSAGAYTSGVCTGTLECHQRS